LKENKKDSTHESCAAAKKKLAKTLGSVWSRASYANEVNTHAQNQTRETAVSDP
jgi:hypothetical protein